MLSRVGQFIPEAQALDDTAAVACTHNPEIKQQVLCGLQKKVKREVLHPICDGCGMRVSRGRCGLRPQPTAGRSRCNTRDGVMHAVISGHSVAAHMWCILQASRSLM